MKVLSFDVESNGLQGDAFAVAGIVTDASHTIHSEFVARCPIIGPVDQWVSENVLGPMSDIKDTHADVKTLRDAFWEWYTEAKTQADFIVASNPYPVEARFLIACQSDDMPTREFEHPFPFYDLSSILFGLGFATALERREFVIASIGQARGDAHNPLWDAKATAWTALKAISESSAKSGIISINSKATA